MNLFSYNAQIAIMAIPAAVLPLIFRLRSPRFLLAYWQCVLAICLLLPIFESRQPARTGGFARFTASSAISASHARFIPEILPLLLLAGAAARLAWLGAGVWRLARIRRRARRLDPAPLWMPEIEQRLGVSPAVYVSAEIAGPASFGSTILFPGAWLEMSPECQRAVACHELLHVRRRDWPVHLIEEAIRAVFWFHPAVWWIVGRIRLMREQVVDREVLRLSISRESYAQALLAAAHANWSPAPCFSRKHQLTWRLERIFEEVYMSKRRVVFAVTGIAIGLAAAGHFAVWSFPMQSSSGKVYRMSEGITPPKLIYKIEPEYTEAARDAKVSGTVLLDIEVTAEGLARNIQVVRGLDPGLDENAIAAVKQWRFQPGMKDGEPVTVAAVIEINFKLK